MGCTHATEAEFKACSTHMTFAMIARAARGLLAARRRHMDAMLSGERDKQDVEQEAMQGFVKELEAQVKRAEQFGYFSD